MIMETIDYLKTFEFLETQNPLQKNENYSMQE